MNEQSPTTGSGSGVRSSPLTYPGLRKATVDDVPRLNAVLAEAFYEDPIFAWLMPDDAKRRARLRRYFAIELRYFALARGRVWSTSDLTGAALSTPPGVWRVPLHATLLEGTAFGIHVPRAARLGATVERRHIRERHYYVRDIGVHPDGQGQGLGSALMQPTLDRCDREGLPAYLEASSERSAALYERLGFKLTGELRVAGSPPLRLMLRPPHPADAVS
ncbi:MAG TPA: GNAT family N-acetyltransferase [Solirubrobacteraceae bacterium]